MKLTDSNAPANASSPGSNGPTYRSLRRPSPRRWLLAAIGSHVVFGFFIVLPFSQVIGFLLSIFGQEHTGLTQTLIILLRTTIVIVGLTCAEAGLVLALEFSHFDHWSRTPLGRIGFVASLGLALWLYIALVGSLSEVFGLRSSTILLGVLPVTMLFLITYMAIAFAIVLLAIGTFYNADLALRRVVNEMSAHQLTIVVCIVGMAIGGGLRGTLLALSH